MRSTIALAALLVFAHAVRADVSKYLPDGTFLVLSADVPKVVNSRLAKQLVPGGNKPTVAEALKELVKLGASADAITAFEKTGAVPLVQGIVDASQRATVVTAQSSGAGPSDTLFLVEGKYDGAKLLRDLKALAKTLNLRVRVETVADQDLITFVPEGAKEEKDLPCLAVVADSLLVVGQRRPVEAVFKRIEAGKKANIHPKMLAALREVPPDAPASFALAVVQGSNQLAMTGQFDLSDKSVSGKVAVTVNAEAGAVALERELLRGLHDAVSEFESIGLADAIRDIRISRDGRKVTLTGSVSPEVLVSGLKALTFGPAQPAPDFVLAGKDQIQAVDVSRDGKQVAAVAGYRFGNTDQPGRLLIWDVARQQNAVEIEPGKDGKHVFFGDAVTFTPDARAVFVQKRSTDFGKGALASIDIGTRKERWQTPGRYSAISPTGKLVAVTANDAFMDASEIRLLDADTGKDVRKITLKGSCTRLFFSPKGDLLGGECRTPNPLEAGVPYEPDYVRTWNTASGQAGAGIRPDGHFLRKHVWFAGRELPSLLERDGTLSANDERGLGQLWLLPAWESPTGLTLSPDGNRLAVVSGFAVRLVDLSGGKTLQFRAKGGLTFSTPASFSADGKLMVVGTGDDVFGYRLK